MEQKAKSVAWFKLADLIARGEREKALNVFRLLSHSLPDRAYALQVEGDLLWHLDDDQSSAEKYKQAAFLYQKEKRWVDAIAIYEHLLTINPTSHVLVTSLLVLYAMLDWPERFEQRLTLLVELFEQRHIDQSMFINAVRDLVEQVTLADGLAAKPWLVQQLSDRIAGLPAPVARALQGLW
jgi:tetratricopeptide (TPR) repeat protein